ncbi:DEAD/DEAH box helicase [Solibacillus cecembensis]|uniref:DEAD/DEAH box helicase n=1 Tax=Solibacillus cecembensis TaxID=459347 RepID=UPI003D03DC13
MTYSIDGISNRLTSKLKEYLETQYPITNPEIQKKRRELLDSTNLLSTEPFIESTPVYKSGEIYSEMNIPEESKEIMVELSKLEPSVGVFRGPYEHQEKAMKYFLSDEKDIIVSTGTGSGKTESFLHPMLSKLYTEASLKPEAFKHKRAVRALILYPMNALVNDQMSRLRLLYGDERVKKMFKDKGGRPLTFGMYTSRTPYAGTQSYGKDRTHLDPLLDYYLKIDEDDPKLASEMKERGRWIAKDIKRFRNSKIKKTKDKYLTSSDDAELFTRHEMHQHSPDILVTNYSMLEYMLMRPIERNMWDETKDWLAQDQENEFILVLDEAHMYRGTSGAEVALLIRRLQQRLGIKRDRMRCILTSASLGKEGDTETAIRFAQKLTGTLVNRSFELIEGVKEVRGKEGVLSDNELELFAKLDIDSFHQRAGDYQDYYKNNKSIFEQFNWAPLPNELDKLEGYLYEQLNGYPPLEKIISLVSGNACTLEKIVEAVYPNRNRNESHQGISNLIILANAAKKNGRVLLPARVHMFFRGISGIYLCLNPNCSGNQGEKSNYGKMYDIPRIQCECGSRVFEILTHMQCGSAFIRLYLNKESAFPKYTWNEKGKGIIDEELTEVHLYIEEQVNRIAREKEEVKAMWIDLKTGYLFNESSDDSLVKVYITNKLPSKRKKKFNTGNLLTFNNCPSCTKVAEGNIRDLRTKGEPPFANLVREQFVAQPPVQGKEEQENNGRKVLIFSDGRQKAARLARDIPREGEKDVLRQMVMSLADSIEDLRVSDYYTYLLFLMKDKNVSLLEGKDKFDIELDKEDIYEIIKYELDNDLCTFDEMDKEDLKEIVDELKNSGDMRQIEKGFETIFYQSLISPGYSLYDLTVGYLVPHSRNLRSYHRNLKDIITREEFNNLCVLFIKSMQENLAFNEQLDSIQRHDIMSQYRQSWGVEKNKLYPTMKKILELYEEDERAKISESLFKLCDTKEGKYFVKAEKLIVVNGINKKWYKCNQCRSWHPVIVRNLCPICFSEDITLHNPDSEVLRSEKGYWRRSIQDLFKGNDIFSFNVEEHSAQLSQKDVKEALATTEKYELGFQDIKVAGQEIVDILSCTTTMEVGIDIGSLTAVAMRNIPPFRENYQQRAGRAGRRSTNLSTVITYAQDSPHDHYYFANAEKMISGDVRDVDIYIDNKKILKRHIHALLIQTYFHEALQSEESDLFASLGKTSDFFDGDSLFTIDEFDYWLTERIGNQFAKYPSMFEIIPDEVVQKESKNKWELMKEVTDCLVKDLEKNYSEIREELQAYLNMVEDDEIEDIPYYQNQDFLTFLFNHEFLPTYAFPRDLSSLYIQKRTPTGQLQIAQRPQLELNRALSEYAPGKQVVIDKETYRVGGIYNPYSTNGENSVVDLFNAQEFVSICTSCHFTQLQSENDKCPNCGNRLDSKQYIKPFGFSPEKGESLRRNEVRQDFSYASSPQLPIPNEEEKFKFKKLKGENSIKYVHATSQELIVLNRGSRKDDGFGMCDVCGFITADREQASIGAHYKPYLAPGNNRCDGQLKNVYLGNRFKTDLLLVRMRLTDERVIYDPSASALHDALETIGEAFVIAASRVLEIDINELGIGYRMIRKGQEDVYADLYIFDKLSGGAGYSYVAGEKIDLIFQEVLKVLSYCPGNCDQSCYKCLRYYDNQFKHSKLDRYLGLDLLTFLFEDKIRDYEESYILELLKKIKHVNDLLEVKSTLNEDKNQIELESGYSVRIRNNIQVREESGILYFSPYEIFNDLPNIHEQIKKHTNILQMY